MRFAPDVAEFYNRIDEIEKPDAGIVLAEDGKVSDTTCQGPTLLVMKDYAKIGRK
jgi:hypothetical protein